MREWKVDLRLLLPDVANHEHVWGILNAATKHSALEWWIESAALTNETEPEENDCE